MSREMWKSSTSLESWGCSGRITVGSILWGMASGVAVVLDIVLGLAEIAPASCQPWQAAWSSLWGVQSSRCGVVALRGSYRSGFCIYTCASGNGARDDPGPPWT